MFTFGKGIIGMVWIDQVRGIGDKDIRRGSYPPVKGGRGTLKGSIHVCRVTIHGYQTVTLPISLSIVVPSLRPSYVPNAIGG